MKLSDSYKKMCVEKEEVAISYYLMIPYSEWWKILLFHQKDEQETLNFLMHLWAWQEEALVHEIAKLLELFREKGGVDAQEDVKKLGNLFRTWLQANTYAKERNLNLTIHVLKYEIVKHVTTLRKKNINNNNSNKDISQSTYWS